jgi:hypothetical protein
MTERDQRVALRELKQGFVKGFRSSGNRTPRYGGPRIADSEVFKNYVPKPARAKVRAQRQWGPWTPEDDDKLREAVQANERGSVSWKRLAKTLFDGKFTNEELHRRWHHSILPRMGKHGEWDPDEVRQLVAAVEACWISDESRVASWPEVSLKLGTGRLAPHCCQRWQRLQQWIASRLEQCIPGGGDVDFRKITPEHARNAMLGVMPDLSTVLEKSVTS